MDDRVLEKKITKFEESRYKLEQFSDQRKKVKALRGTISMIQQVVRYAHDYHVDTIVICDYVSCVVITMPPRLKSANPNDPPKYKDNSTFEWYFASRTQTGNMETGREVTRQARDWYCSSCTRSGTVACHPEI